MEEQPLPEPPPGAFPVHDVVIDLGSNNVFHAELAWTADQRVHAVRVRPRLTRGNGGTFGPQDRYRSWRSRDVVTMGPE